ncbi:MAG: ATP/GTP-binding protein [Candidatus Heimdallarchaeota archaeon]|nr:ATP/GTP-binding protein [Candidatus Heimdallarchaeota archaeon]MDH5645503.1 ATP/GTP-binding protein [Candidatus Heimdallarchaeota archaeon]
MNIGYILGPAGSGKSHLTASLYSWMNLVGLDVITLNLDPAVVRLPYAPDIDVRNFVDYNELVEKYELGPNGGIIVAMDHVALAIDDIIDEMRTFGAEYVLIDLPGQIETVAFRSSGSVIINELSRGNQMAGLFLIDPTLCLTASSFISVLLFGISINYRLKTPINYLISKSDLLSDERATRINEWIENIDFLYNDLNEESFILNSELSRKIAEIILLEEGLGEFPLVSASTNKNMDIVFASLQRNWNSDSIF